REILLQAHRLFLQFTNPPPGRVTHRPMRVDLRVPRPHNPLVQRLIVDPQVRGDLNNRAALRLPHNPNRLRPLRRRVMTPPPSTSPPLPIVHIAPWTRLHHNWCTASRESPVNREKSCKEGWARRPTRNPTADSESLGRHGTRRLRDLTSMRTALQ